MKKRELKFPVVFLNGKEIGYGGNQEWFSDFMKRKAGCGCTSGANFAAYYASRYPQMESFYDGNTDQFHHHEYLLAMETLYRYMKPGLIGYPYTKKFGKQFVRYCKERGILAESVYCYGYKTKEEAFQFVKDSIDGGHPVGLLILFHRAPSLKEDNWHWVTITGYEENMDEPNDSNVLFSNCGERQIVKASILFEVHRKNTLRMVSFRMKEDIL